MPNLSFDMEKLEFEVLEIGVTKDIISQVVRSVNGQTRKIFREYAKYMYQSASKREELNTLNRRTAMGALDAARESYLTRKSKPYRYAEPNIRHRRDSGGLMIAALSDYRAVEWGYDGFNLYLASQFDRYAKQWYRLNFGASPKVTPEIGYGTMSFGGQDTGFGLTLSQYPSSKPFLIPYGIFATDFNPTNGYNRDSTISPSSRRGDAFYVLGGAQYETDRKQVRSLQREYRAAGGRGKGPTFADLNKDSTGRKVKPVRPKISAGILGSRYLDKGVMWANQYYGPGLTRVVETWHEQATARAAAAARATRGR